MSRCSKQKTGGSLESEKSTATVHLDGATISINWFSRLTWPQQPFDVFLTGEAYVTTFTDRYGPYRLHFKGITIESKTAVYNINTYDMDIPIWYNGQESYSNEARLTIVEGEVTVRYGDSSVVVTAGNAVEVGRGYVSPYRNWSADESLTWVKGYYSYRHIRMAEFIKLMERLYHAEVTIDSGLADRYLYDVYFLTDTPLYKQLKPIEERNGLKITFDGLKMNIGYK